MPLKCLGTWVDLRVDPGLRDVIRSRWASSSGTIRCDRALRIGAAAPGAGPLIPHVLCPLWAPRHDRPYRAAGDVAPCFRDSKSRFSPAGEPPESLRPQG